MSSRVFISKVDPGLSLMRGSESFSSSIYLTYIHHCGRRYLQSETNTMEKTLQVSNEADTESNENVSGETPKIDPVVEKSLVRRMDLILLPTLCKTDTTPQKSSHLVI